MPTVTVLYFAQARDRLGMEAETLTLPASVDADTVLGAIRLRHPSHAALIDRCRVAVDHEFVTGSMTLTEHSEIALIPPVSGG